jgi:hypothetical protein
MISIMEKFLKHLSSFGVLFVSIMLFVGSSSTKDLSYNDITYKNPRQNAGLRDTTISYELPVIKPDKQTKQVQNKGGVTVTCEVNEFSVDKTFKTDRKATFADGNSPNSDVFETIKRPSVFVNPDNITFKITVKNNQDRTLKLIEVPIVLIVDGVQYTIPNDYLIDWKNALIVKGFSKEYFVKGPQTSTLKNAKVIYLSINDIPTSLDKAGNILSKDNFEWYFECSLENKSTIEKNEYSYETTPIESKQCSACTGQGFTLSKGKCDNCAGTGKLKNKEGKISDCWKCKGLGELNYKYTCNSCSSTGILKFPQSPPPQAIKSVYWSGWEVEIKTIPAGVATVSTMDAKSRIYRNWGLSNRSYEWYGTDGTEEFPIILEYKNTKIAVVPYDPKGKKLSKVEVDFSAKEPIVKIGTQRKVK